MRRGRFINACMLCRDADQDVIAGTYSDFDRSTLNDVMVDVKKHFPKDVIKAAWVHKSGNIWEFVINKGTPGLEEGFHWHGQAGSAYDAKASGWESLLRSNDVQGYGFGDESKNASVSREADTGDVATYLNIDEFVQAKSEGGKKAWIPSEAVDPLINEIGDASLAVRDEFKELVRNVLVKNRSFKKLVDKFNLESKV